MRKVGREGGRGWGLNRRGRTKEGKKLAVEVKRGREFADGIAATATCPFAGAKPPDLSTQV